MLNKLKCKTQYYIFLEIKQANREHPHDPELEVGLLDLTHNTCSMKGKTEILIS